MTKRIENQIKLKLPLPCSVNIAYVNAGKKRIKSQAYIEYLEKVKLYFLENELEYKIIGDEWLEVNYIYYFNILTKEGKKRITDVANLEKVLSDSITHFISGFEDHKIKKIFMEKINSEEEYVEVIIKEII